VQRDTVYADNPLSETVTLPDGRIWRNLVTEEKSKVAETLTEYRGQFACNLLDAYLRAFVAEVPQINQWDDHEVVNNSGSGRVRGNRVAEGPDGWVSWGAQAMTRPSPVSLRKNGRQPQWKRPPQ